MRNIASGVDSKLTKILSGKTILSFKIQTKNKEANDKIKYVFDFGELRPQYFISMDIIPEKNLEELTEENFQVQHIQQNH